MCGFSNVWLSVGVVFVVCERVYLWAFVMCGCVYVWVFLMCGFV
jgi:hypothetical protein